MICCTFAGHRNIFSKGIEERIRSHLDGLIEEHQEICFYCGGMGEFDTLCAHEIKRLKTRYPSKNILLLLVAPYMTNKINTCGTYLNEFYDEIIIPSEISHLHYKRAIQARNRWMVDRSQYLICHAIRQSGGAWKTILYAQKKGRIILNC